MPFLGITMTGFNKYNSGYGDPCPPGTNDLLVVAFKDLDHSGDMPKTVSPSDLFLDAPNSSVFSQLDTPSMYDGGSPDDSENYDTSPMLTSIESLGSFTDSWYPLFQANETLDDTLQHSTSLISSLEVTDDSLPALSAVTKSIEAGPPALLRALSTPSGVHKNRRTGKTLEPIELEELDVVSAKRAKNTMAARKSRQKKRDIEEQLRIELAAMTAERDKWMHEAIRRGALPPTPKM